MNEMENIYVYVGGADIWWRLMGVGKSKGNQVGK